ncbi:MAG: energy transducer TonB [bacterium]
MRFILCLLYSFILTGHAIALTFGEVALVEDGSYVFLHRDMEYKEIVSAEESISCIVETTPIHIIEYVYVYEDPPATTIKIHPSYDYLRMSNIEILPKSVFGRDVLSDLIEIDLHVDTIVVEIPNYPEKALKPGVDGWVIVSTIIDTLGRSSNTSILRSSGNQALDKSALDIVKDTEFSPITLDGREARVVLLIPIKFKLICVQE